MASTCVLTFCSTLAFPSSPFWASPSTTSVIQSAIWRNSGSAKPRVVPGGERLDLIMILKVGTAADVYAVDMMVNQIEDAKGYKKRIGFEHVVETALGMQNVTEIAAASKRNESLHFEVADYAASTRARMTIIGGVNPNYSVLTDLAEDGSRDIHWSDMWHYALARMVVAARANGLRPVDGPFTQVRSIWQTKS